jgi:DNA invertase Pin-like site-specific DNA recombinase
MQILAMQQYALKKNWVIKTQVEEKCSGASHRPEREGLLELARNRELDIILVWRLDRWGRSVTDLLNTFQELEQLGVGFVSITEELDFTKPTGRAMAGLLAIFSEFEREILRERVKAGIAHARKNGKRHGRPRIKDRKIKQVKALAEQNLSKSEIARRVKISRASVRRILQGTKE